MSIVLRASVPDDAPADVVRAARRTRDAWLGMAGPRRVVLPEDPAARDAGWELIVREPEAMVAPGALAGLSLDGEGAIAPEGFFPGGSAPAEAYATVWEFEREAGRRGAGPDGPAPFPAGLVPPAELRRAGERGRAQTPPALPAPGRGWVVHSFAGRRSWERAELLRFVPPSTRTVLEVGCGEGGFASLLEAGGAAVTAVEPDGAAAATARRRVTRLLEATLEGARGSLAGERFDLVVLADVLEHLPDPVAALEELRPLLAPGGAFLLSLPNGSHASVLAGALQGRWDHALEGTVADDHQTYAGRAGWNRILAAAGLGVEEWESAPFASPSLEPWIRLLEDHGLSRADLEAVQWTGLARLRPGAPGPDPGLPPVRRLEGGELDADDPVASVRRLLEGGRELLLRTPNAVAVDHLLPLFSGDLAGGEGRTALVRGTTAEGLARRFRGSGIALEVEASVAGAGGDPLSRLAEKALGAGLPAAPGAFAAARLGLRFVKERA